MDKPCFFCDVQKEADAQKYAENATCFARFDDFPVSKGHSLIVAKGHVATPFDMSEEEAANMHALLKEVRLHIDDTHHPDGYTIGFNVREAGGQTVPHVHMQVIPRYDGDVAEPRGGIRNLLPNGDYSEAAKKVNRDKYL